MLLQHLLVRASLAFLGQSCLLEQSGRRDRRRERWMEMPKQPAAGIRLCSALISNESPFSINTL